MSRQAFTTSLAAPALLAATVLSSAAQAQEQSYTIDPEHTFPTYAIEHFGVSLQQGRFDQTRGKIILDPAARSGRVEVVVQAASVDSGLPSLDRRLRGDGFFNAERYPQIVYRSTSIRFENDQPIALDGELTMLGVTRPLALEVTRFRCTVHPLAGGKRCGAMVRGTVRRSDFALSSIRPPLLGDEVQLVIPIEATLDAAPPVDGWPSR